MKKSLFLRTLVFALAILMALGCAAGCKKDPNNNEGESTTTGEQGNNDNVGPVIPEGYIDVDITKYVIMRPDKTSSAVLEACSSLRNDIESETEYKIQIKNDWTRDESTIDTESFEILVGLTNRPQSKELYAKLEGLQWGISVIGNKIVILGTNDVMTAAAVDYFVSTYVIPYADKNVIRIPEGINEISGQYEPTSLVENGKLSYKIIFKSGLDTTAGSSDTDKYDYPVQKVHDLMDAINAKTGLTSKFGSDAVASGTDTSIAKEILVGQTNRAETAEFLSTISPNQYGYAIIGNKIVISGWSDLTTGLAVDMFIKMIDNTATKDSEGVAKIDIIYSSPVISTYSSYVTNIPELEGATLQWCADLTDGGLEYYYKNANAVAYGKYVEKLISNGYKLYFENTSAGNKYATYTSASTMIHVYYTQYDSSIRLITAPMSSTVLPNVTAESYTKVTEPSITQLMLTGYGGSGNCYILTLEDGSYVLFDGGTGTAGNVDRLYKFLEESNKRPDGKIVIAAWILSHEHGDHYGLFVPFCEKYGKNIKIEQFICNTPSEVFAFNPRDGASPYTNSFARGAYAVGGIKVVKAHTGQIIKIRNAEIEVIFTIEDIFPFYMHIFNDTSMVVRVKMGGQTVMMLGDAEQQASLIMSKMYGSYLKSDFVQISHHGYGMAPLSLYTLIDADYALWPCSNEDFVELTRPNGTGYKAIGYKLVTQGGFKEIHVADDTTKTFVLPYAAGKVIEKKD